MRREAIMKRVAFVGILVLALAAAGRDVTITYRGRAVGDDDRVVKAEKAVAVLGVYESRLAGEPLFVATNAVSPGANGAFQTAFASPAFAGLVQSNRLNYVGLTLLTNGVAVGGGEMQPRQPILPHPLAGVAHVADELMAGGDVTKFEATGLYADSIVCPTDAPDGESCAVRITESLAGVGGSVDLTGKWSAGRGVEIRAAVATGAFAGEWTDLGTTWSRNWNVPLIKGERPTDETLVLNGSGAYFFSSLGELSAAAAPASYAELNELRDRGWRMPGMMLFSQTNALENAFGVFESCCKRKDRTGEKYARPAVKAHYLPFNAGEEGGAE